MMKLNRMFAVFGVVAGMGLTPLAASADGGLLAADQGSLGTVESSAVTAPITIGGITYIPGPATGGASGGYLGTVETPATVAPITEGQITYIPGAASGSGMAVGGASGQFLGTVQTNAVVAPITEGGITYVPD